MEDEIRKASQFALEMAAKLSIQPRLDVENPQVRDFLKEHTAIFSGGSPGGPSLDHYRRRVAEELTLNALKKQRRVLEQATKADVGIGEVPALLAEIIPETVHDALVPMIANVHVVTTVKGKIRKKGAQLSTTKSSTTPGDDARDLETVDADYSKHTELASDIGEIKQDAKFIDYEVESRMLRYAYSIEAGLAGSKELGEDTLADGLREAADRITLEIDASATAAILASTHAGNVNWSETPSGTILPSELLAHDKTLLKKLEEAALLVVAKKGFRPNVLLAGSTVCRIIGNFAEREFKVLDDKVLGMIQGDQTLAVPIGTLATKLGVWIVIYVPWLDSGKAVLCAVTTKRGRRQSGLDFFVFQALYSTDSVLNTTDGSYSALCLEMVDIVVGEPFMFSTLTITSS